jgi:hypothetical protein
MALRDLNEVFRLTRNWIHYGFIGHSAICVLVGAVEGLLGR